MTVAPILALALSGCEGSLRFLSPSPQPVVIPAGDKVIENGAETIIEPPARLLCQARAKHFRGTVSLPCEDIARQIAP